MTKQRIVQHGTFHVTTNAKNKIPWCTWRGIPEILIDNLVMTKNIQKSEIFAFCILPDHMHIIVRPGQKGLSAFMHSFKRNSSWHVRQMITPAAEAHEPPLRNLHNNRAQIRGSVTPAIDHQFSGWHNGFHDELIRDSNQRSNAISYVEYNAFKHNLAEDPDAWPWSSIQFKHLLNEMDIWID